MGTIGRLLAVLVVALAPAATAHAQTDGFLLEVTAFPDEVVPSGADVSFFVGLLVPNDEAVTVTGVSSDLYGDVADATNPELVDTSCVVPAARLPGDLVGAFSWGCSYTVNIAGDPGEIVDTVTLALTRADASEVTLTDTVSVSISLELGAIRGTVVDDVTGAAVVGVRMMAWGPTNAEVSTDALGGFSLDGLAPGDYRLVAGNLVTLVSSDYAVEWYDDAPDMASADPVTVVGGEVTTLTWGLSLGGVIEGTVTDESTGEPLPGADVSWVAVSPDGTRQGPNGVTAAADGAYRIVGLHEVGVLVCFSATDYLRECWNDIPAPEFPGGLPGIPGDQVAAAPRTVVSNIDAALARVPAPTTTTLAPPPTTLVPPGGALPATGTPGAQLTIVALAAVLAGLVALGAARRSTRRP